MLQQGTNLPCYKVFEPETPSIREDLVTFLECDSVITGKALADKVLGFIINQLDPSKMHGQAYDGALDHIPKLYSSIVACFENISDEGSRMWSFNSETDASTLLLVLTRTEFISAFLITNECLQ